MKKIVVFGAGGRTGKYIVQYALEAGHLVTGFELHQKNDEPVNERLKMIVGDVQDKEKVREAIQGQDVVISALGTNQIDGDAVNMMSDAMKIFVEIMEPLKIKRVLAVGGKAVLQYDEHTQLIDRPDYPAAYKNVGVGHNKVYQVLSNTALDWTFVCCPDIIAGPKTGKYAVKKDYPIEHAKQIFTGDIADFMMKEIEENKFLKTRVGIGNTE